MSKIVPVIYKYELPKELLYPLKYSDIEACFLGRSAGDIYLNVHFWYHKGYAKDIGNKLEYTSQYQIVRFNYHPEVRSFYNSPWRNVENPTVVSVTINSIPGDVAKKSGIDRKMLRQLIFEEVGKLIPKGLPCDRWHFQVTLMAKTARLECISQVWNGMRQEPETKLLVSLNETKQTTNGSSSSPE